MLRFTFNFDATLEASAIVLRCHDGAMGYIRLLKLLYIADRELLVQSGLPLTGDRAVAMDYGPVLSHTYDIIKQTAAESERWSQVVRKSGHTVRLVGDPGHRHLSKGQVAKLTELCDRFMGVDDFTLAKEVTHKFPEWQSHHVEGTSRPIPWDAAVVAQGRPELVVAIERDVAAMKAFDDLLASVK